MFLEDSKPDVLAPLAIATSDLLPQGNRRPIQSIISRDLRIQGDLVCIGEVQIDGAVEGYVQSSAITIGEGAEIRGTVSGENILVLGSVNGRIKGTSVVLAKTARVIGDVIHQTLSIEPGASFEGRCSRIDSWQSDGRVVVVKGRPLAGSSAAPSDAATR